MIAAIALGFATVAFAFAAYASHRAAKAHLEAADVYRLVARMIAAPDKATADELAYEFALSKGLGFKPQPVKPAASRRQVG